MPNGRLLLCLRRQQTLLHCCTCVMEEQLQQIDLLPAAHLLPLIRKLTADLLHILQIDLNVALSSRLRRVEADLGTGTLRMRKLYSDPLEMVVINESLMGTQQRFVYGCQTILQPNMASMGIVKVRWAVIGYQRLLSRRYPLPIHKKTMPSCVAKKGLL